jgi:hypothetical protein
MRQHGSFSLGVNYHALGRYAERLGGTALFGPQLSHTLCVGAFLLGAPASGAETKAAFARAVSDLGPDAWCALATGAVKARKEMSLPQLLATTDLGGPDAWVLMNVLDRLHELTPRATYYERRVALGLARRAWEIYYDIGERQNLAHDLGVWLRALGYPLEASDFFKRSQERPVPPASSDEDEAP